MEKPPKLSQSEILIRYRRWVREEQHRVARNEYAKRLRFNENFQRNPRNPDQETRQVIKKPHQSIKIYLPKKFDLHRNTEEVLERMNEFRHRVDLLDSLAVDLRNARIKELVFDEITYIDGSSALMLAAEVHAWNIKTTNASRTSYKKSINTLHARHKHWNPEIKRLLSEMGLFQLLNLPSQQNSSAKSNDMRFLKFMSGDRADGKSARELREKIEDAIGQNLETEKKLSLFEGLTEAFTNTAQHAYPPSTPRKSKTNKWWLTAAYCRSKKILHVAIYDRGQGIPNTIHKYRNWRDVEQLLMSIVKSSGDLTGNHADLIAATMEASFNETSTRSRTKKSHRGKGLGQFLGFIGDTGQLTIISNNGYCQFAFNHNKLEIKSKKTLKNSLQGTLIEWQFQF